MVINFKNRFLNRFLVIALIFLGGFNVLLPAACHQSQGVESQGVAVNPDITSIIEDAYQALGLKNSSMEFVHTQTMAYLERPGLRGRLAVFQNNVNSIGSEFFKNLFEKIIRREIAYKDKFCAFYHGQRREFMLIQDLYKGLYELVYKIAFIDFVMLRVPDKDFYKFKSVVEFLKHYIKSGEISDKWFDDRDDIKKILLSVNPSPFGNSYNFGESTFYYFLSSSNASSASILPLAASVFEYFNLKSCFDKHRSEIEELSNLLSDYESGKTGLLLQIFIPKTLVNQIAYRCKPWGLLYYDGQRPEDNFATGDLQGYQSGTSPLDDSSFDSAQFRLLINKTMLDPHSGVKIFRYFNETPKFIEYKIKLKRLLDKIEKEAIK